MKRCLLLALVMSGLLGSAAGCHAPVPKMGSLWPYSSTRVPPPGTSSYGSAADSYYEGRREPPVGTQPVPPAGMGVRTDLTPPVTDFDRTSVADATGIGRFRSATVPGGTPITPTRLRSGQDGAIQVLEPPPRRGASTTPLRLNGMTAHLIEPPPGRLVRMTELPPAALPDALSGRRIRGLTPRSVRPAGYGTSRYGGSSYGDANYGRSNAAGWQPRYGEDL